jgi:hypothetical protein
MGEGDPPPDVTHKGFKSLVEQWIDLSIEHSRLTMQVAEPYLRRWNSVLSSIEPGSVIHTDGWVGYDPLERKGYGHRVTFLKGQKESASELLPRVHLGYAPGCRKPRASGLLPGRLHLPLQPTKFA